MRFKKGSKVEVLSKKEVSSGSWCCAEIMSGDGHNYSVKYDCSPGMTCEVVVERVSRKAIRPCPPVVAMERWAASDVVEVYNDVSWKIAMVLKVMSGEYYLVKLLGSSREFKVHKINIRLRQSWQDGNWVVIGKGMMSVEDVKFNKLSTLNCDQTNFPVPRANVGKKVQAIDDCLAVQNNIGLQESHIVSSRTLKRASPYCSSHVEVYTGNAKKMRAFEKESRSQQVAQGQLLEKVDAVAYPQENLGEKYMHASFNNRTTGYYKMEKGKPNGVVECFLAGGSEPNDFDSDTCSVGSCSIINDRTNKFPNRILSGPSQDEDTLCSDAESFYDSGDEEEKCSLSPKEELTARIHKLELHAYRSTLEAFYASGPLSWEQEALLTNLRLSLHISNDVHLMEGQSWRHAFLASKGLKMMLGFATFLLE